MQMIDYNRKYASDVAGADAVSAAEASGGPNGVLELVLDDEPSFGSAAWFIKTQCSQQVRDGLAAGTAEGWGAYLTQCVGTTQTEERDAIWRKALAALQGGAGGY